MIQHINNNFRCNAKYLWKRIPQSVENANPELFAIWSVGQKMWKRDLPGTYQSLAAYSWSEPVAKIMTPLEGMNMTMHVFIQFLILIDVNFPCRKSKRESHYINCSSV